MAIMSMMNGRLLYVRLEKAVVVLYGGRKANPPSNFNLDNGSLAVFLDHMTVPLVT